MVGTHQPLMLRNLLNHVDFLARQIGLMDREMAERMRPFEACRRDAGRHLQDCTTVSCGGCQRLQHVGYRVPLEEVA